MKRLLGHWWKQIVLGVVLLILVVAGVAAYPYVLDWFQRPDERTNPREDTPGSAQLIYDSFGRPGLQLSDGVVRALGVTTARVKPVSRAKPLPGLLGQLAYDSDRLYPVRSIANGRVIRIETRFDAAAAGTKNGGPYRNLSFGDKVEKNELLAVVRSESLAEKKANYVDAFLDLSVERERLEGLEGPYLRGAIPEATYRDAVSRVQKAVNTLAKAEGMLFLTGLTSNQVKELRKEAEEIRKDFRQRAKKIKPGAGNMWGKDKMDQWARVEVRAPEAGTIVEKNTNVGDIADPGKDPPLFRIADLSTLGVWLNPQEEYLPVLVRLMKAEGAEPVGLEVRLQSDPNAAPIEGQVVLIAPSLDPFQKTPLVVGRISVPKGRRLLVGQLIKATLFIPQETDLVEIPTTALNEVGGESLVFVKSGASSGGKPAFIARRVEVVQRFADVVQVRKGQEIPAGTIDNEAKQLIQEINRWLDISDPLSPGDQVVTGGVVEMTAALEELQAKTKSHQPGGKAAVAVKE
jgi:hypothetical protein